MIDAMLTRTALRASRPSDIIASTKFSRHLLDKVLGKRLPTSYSETEPPLVIEIGQQLAKDHHIARLFTVVYSLPNHWIYLCIDLSKGLVRWSDHMLERKLPVGLETHVKNWVRFFVPSRKNLKFERMQSLKQPDFYSCGIIAISTLSHAVLGDAPWSQGDRETLRVMEFIKIDPHGTSEVRALVRLQHVFTHILLKASPQIESTGIGGQYRTRPLHSKIPLQMPLWCQYVFFLPSG